MVEEKGLWSVKFEKHGSTKYSVLSPIKTSESLAYTSMYSGSLRRHSVRGVPTRTRHRSLAQCLMFSERAATYGAGCGRGVADGSLFVADSADCD